MTADGVAAQVRWEMLPSAEILARRGDWVIVPMAQIEGHGEFLPVGTDRFIVEHIAETAASRGGALVGPTIQFGNCFDFEGWPGYITVSNPTFLQLVKDYADSLLRQCFPRIVFLVNHGGHNFNAIDLALDGMRLGEGVHVVLVTTAMLAPGLAARWSELGADPDLSAMMALRPELVNTAVLRRSPPPRDLSELRSRRGRHYGADFALARSVPEGIPLNSPDSSPELGRRFLDDCVEALVGLLREGATA